jgi:hypothetical protein
MKPSTMPFADDAAGLRAAAMRLDDDAAGPASVDVVATSLADVERALRALSHAIDHAGDALIPPARGGEAAAARHARAAAEWPRVGAGGPPSHERQAHLLSSLHEAAATIRAAAECCGRARRIVESTVACS